MNRAVLGALAAAAIGVLLWAWFVTHFEQVELKVPVASAARANPYLAAMRFAERLGWSAQLARGFAQFDQNPTRATVLLPAERPRSAREVQAILARAARGDHVIAEIEPSERSDTLLDTLAMHRHDVDAASGSFQASVAEAGAEITLESLGNQVIELGPVHADLLLADDHGPRLASVRHGSGRITVLVAMRRFDNRHIGRLDHAELLRQLLAQSPADRFVVVRAPQTPGVAQWLAENASGAVAAAALVLALTLWRLLPRFGPVLPAPETPRRQLLEHLRAAGRFRWSRGSHAELLAAARDELERHAAQAAPRLRHLSAQQRYAELTAQWNIDPEVVQRALRATPRSGREMVQITAVLASIHAGLRGARPRFRPRRTRR